MVLSVIAHIFALLLELVRISRISDHDKDLEILVLHYQDQWGHLRRKLRFEP